MLLALPSDLSYPTLGMESSTYYTPKSEVTDVIHCASVYFNMQLTSFEKKSIGGLKTSWTYVSEPKGQFLHFFNFCTSISAVGNTESEDIPEALPVKLGYAQGMGYAQSKLVGEPICAHVAQHTGIRARVLRIGQVIGDQQHGVWNATEAISLMLQSATTMGALPKPNESPLWLPVDIMAGTVIEISLSFSNTVDSGLVFNIVSQHRAEV